MLSLILASHSIEFAPSQKLPDGNTWTKLILMHWRIRGCSIEKKQKEIVYHLKSHLSKWPFLHNCNVIPSK
jgi:hypothetical protein